MGFHCGNTAVQKLSFCEMKYRNDYGQSTSGRSNTGTLEGDIVPGDITFFRLRVHQIVNFEHILHKEKCCR